MSSKMLNFAHSYMYFVQKTGHVVAYKLFASISVRSTYVAILMVILRTDFMCGGNDGKHRH